jgi:23S rRNA (guanosine2251-2'-O)-methyltransferase
MMGEVSSLNVSVAGGIVMYELARQRRAASEAIAGAHTPGSKKAKPSK